eukprot:scaffold213_cov245-Pinguiococcus_pyrenoidosus.AAC.21
MGRTVGTGVRPDLLQEARHAHAEEKGPQGPSGGLLLARAVYERQLLPLTRGAPKNQTETTQDLGKTFVEMLKGGPAVLRIRWKARSTGCRLSRRRHCEGSDGGVACRIVGPKDRKIERIMIPRERVAQDRDVHRLQGGVSCDLLQLTHAEHVLLGGVLLGGVMLAFIPMLPRACESFVFPRTRSREKLHGSCKLAAEQSSRCSDHFGRSIEQHLGKHSGVKWRRQKPQELGPGGQLPRAVGSSGLVHDALVVNLLQALPHRLAMLLHHHIHDLVEAGPNLRRDRMVPSFHRTSRRSVHQLQRGVFKQGGPKFVEPLDSAMRQEERIAHFRAVLLFKGPYRAGQNRRRKS